MPCDTQPFRQGQTLTERKEQVLEAIARLNKGLVSGSIKVRVGPQGAVVFDGFADRAGVTDACAYRRIMAIGSSLARQQIAKAELLAGRSVNKQVVGQGAHSHDGGATWHNHKG